MTLLQDAVGSGEWIGRQSKPGNTGDCLGGRRKQQRNEQSSSESAEHRSLHWRVWLVSAGMGHGSVSVFQSVSVFRYTGRGIFFKSVRYFVVGFSKYRDICSVFSVFHFACRFWPKIGLHVRVAAAVRTSAELPMLEGGSELSSLDASNPEELSPYLQINCAQLLSTFYARGTCTMPLKTLHARR